MSSASNHHQQGEYALPSDQPISARRNSGHRVCQIFSFSKIDNISLPLPAEIVISDNAALSQFDMRLLESDEWVRARNWGGPVPALAGPGLGFVLFNLWRAALCDRPAGSLPDDELDLCEGAGCNMAYWRAVKAEALKNWQLIEGRWHHRAISAMALLFWTKELKRRHQRAYHSWWMAQRRLKKGKPLPVRPAPFAEWISQNFAASAKYLSALDAPRGVEGSQSLRDAPSNERNELLAPGAAKRQSNICSECISS